MKLKTNKQQRVLQTNKEPFEGTHDLPVLHDGASGSTHPVLLRGVELHQLEGDALLDDHELQLEVLLRLLGGQVLLHGGTLRRILEPRQVDAVGSLQSGHLRT